MAKTISSLSDLEKVLKAEIKKALSVTRSKAEADMYEETGGFYVGTKPKIYERTGALGDTPRTTAISSSGNETSFEAYLDTNHQYTTGDNPSMEQVLMLANYDEPWTTQGGAAAHPVIGKRHFWDRAQEKMKKTASNTFGQFFDK